MYERLDKLRAEVERIKKKIEDDKARLRAAELKLKNAENSQILADVGALNMSPEQLAQFLQLVQQGQVGNVVVAKPEIEAKEDDIDDIEKEEDEENEDY
ncbi:protein of unknown function [Pseudobutyrivibrio sp. YE44]|uniref:DUF4315 family protein n=1 Tax=Pseudobutyrivibrio sp. YE44 TaxID=1520802 RepID=UPI00088BC363|nr:DUF4315 family protein [Pseudobutyrivibrio sp. YE44]SDB44996.1 protein of unknown function [Pseudobutyrivibrio sp. YE44]